MTVPSESDSGSYNGEYIIRYQPSKWEKKWVTLPNSTMRVFKWVKIPEKYIPQMEREDYMERDEYMVREEYMEREEYNEREEYVIRHPY